MSICVAHNITIGHLEEGWGCFRWAVLDKVALGWLGLSVWLHLSHMQGALLASRGLSFSRSDALKGTQVSRAPWSVPLPLLATHVRSHLEWSVWHGEERPEFEQLMSLCRKGTLDAKSQHFPSTIKTRSYFTPAMKTTFKHLKVYFTSLDNHRRKALDLLRS